MKDNDIEKLNLKIKWLNKWNPNTKKTVHRNTRLFIVIQDFSGEYKTFQGNLLLSLIITLYKENPTSECGTTSSP